VPISELNIQAYRKQIAMVSQEPVRLSHPLAMLSILNVLQTLYAGTIRFNILLGAVKPVSDVTQEEIEQACRNANILNFINSLPEFVFYSCLLDD
jgi:ATP-binding cassette subfamily B (MDR/TAP) protein 1